MKKIVHVVYINLDIFLFKLTPPWSSSFMHLLSKDLHAGLMPCNNNKPLIPFWHYNSWDHHELNGIHHCQYAINDYGTFIHYLYLLELGSSQRNTQCIRWKSRLFVTIKSWIWHPISPLSDWMFAQHLPAVLWYHVVT